jgi:hypothetical protein
MEPLHTTVGEITREPGGLPYIDVTFSASGGKGSAGGGGGDEGSVASEGEAAPAGPAGAAALACIRFRNYYVYTVTVRQLMTPPAEAGRGPPRWSTLLDAYQIMRSPHHEDDAQAWHVVGVEDFRPGSFYPERLERLRFVLEQPSGMWRTTTLHSIECFAEPPASEGRSRASATTATRTATARATSSPSERPPPGSPSSPARSPGLPPPTAALSSSSPSSSSSSSSTSSTAPLPSGSGITRSPLAVGDDDLGSVFDLHSVYEQQQPTGDVDAVFLEPASAVANMQVRASEIRATLQKLGACAPSKIGNPGSALNFSGGPATVVRIMS